MTCTCNVCIRAREFSDRLQAVPLEHHEFFEDIMSDLDHAELDRDVNEAIIDGDWPSANEQLLGHHRRLESSRAVIDQMARILCKKKKPPRGQKFRCEFCHCFVERPCYNLNETTNCKLF